MTLALDGVSLTLHGAALLRPFSLAIAAGETVTLMGPSGSGKSSLIAFIAGDLALPLAGTGQVLVDGEDVSMLAPECRRIGRLFQDDVLFPHLTVGENLLFGMARGDRHQRITRVREALETAGLGGFANRNPQTLSGGQRARVSLLRALLASPRAMLLDEPFSKLDMELRQQMRSFVFDHLATARIPALLVSHDRADAPSSGRVLTIRDGALCDD